MTTPPLPSGYQLEQSSSMPPLPAGYSVEQQQNSDKPFSVMKTAGKTALKVGEASLSPSIVSEGTVNPEYSLYQQGLRFNLNAFKSPVDPSPQPTGVSGFLARHSSGTLKEENGTPRKDYTPRTPQEQAEFQKVVGDMSVQNPGWAKNMKDSLKNLSPVVLNGQQWESDPNEAASTSLANLIMLRQGLKIPGMNPSNASAAEMLGKVGKTVENAAPEVGKAAGRAAGYGGIGEFFHSGNPVALAGPILRPVVQKGATQATSWMGQFLQKAGSGLKELSPEQESIAAQAESAARAVPTGEAPPAASAPSTLPRVASGEGVLNQALTSLDNKSLLKVARSRGIDVTKEAQLKPGAANGSIIKKIIDDFSPDELDEIRNMGMEISRHVPVQNPNITPAAAAEAWHYKVLSQFFPDVSVPKAMELRAQATIANRPTGAATQAEANFKAARAAAESKANAVPMDEQPQLATEENTLELLKKSFERARAAKMKAGRN